MDPVECLRRIAFVLESRGEPTYRVRAFRRAAATIAALEPGRLAELEAAGRLRELPGIGEAIERVIREALRGGTPAYLAGLEEESGAPLAPHAQALREALRGDCHVHSDWSDGGSPVLEMAETAIALGHEYMVLTDHSPRLKVAGGLSPARLREQLEVVAWLNQRLGPFRILTGIEVDILEDGGLDQEEDLLARLDVVVASVHSLLRMESAAMTRRMVAAVANPYLDILGHCTGRLLTGRGRPESTFDAALVFAACARFDKAVEINSRPERLDPPDELIEIAVDLGCRFAIDSDAHAPGQMAWLRYGCEKAAKAGVEPAAIVNTLAAQDLLSWGSRHAYRSAP